MNKRHISWQQLERHVNEVCRQIAISQWMPDCIVGITRGGLVPATMISNYLNVQMVALGVSLRDHLELGLESNCWLAEWAHEGKNILIVDDINDTGATIDWIIKDWTGSVYDSQIKWGENVRFATVVDNQGSEFKNVNYASLLINKVEQDEWICFPWENYWAQ